MISLFLFRYLQKERGVILECCRRLGTCKPALLGGLTHPCTEASLLSHQRDPHLVHRMATRGKKLLGAPGRTTRNKKLLGTVCRLLRSSKTSCTALSDAAACATAVHAAASATGRRTRDMRGDDPRPVCFRSLWKCQVT